MALDDELRLLEFETRRRLELVLGPDVLARAISRREVMALGGLASLAVALSACGGNDKTTTGALAEKTDLGIKGGGKAVAHVNWGISADIVGFDPVVSYDYATTPVLLHSVETLLRLDNNNQIAPHLAESWKQESLTRYVYTIRQGIKFHDGSPMTAEDVAYSINRHRDPKIGSYLMSFTTAVKNVTAEGNTVIVELSHPDAIWKYVPCLPVGAVISKRNVEATLRAGKKPGLPSTPVIGTGPYKFASWQKGQDVKLARFDGYWDKSRALKVKDVSFRVVTDGDTLASAVLGGDLQGTFDLNGKAVQPLQRQVNVFHGPSMDVRLVGYNVTKPPFDDPRVRQALSHAIDKQGLLASAYGNEGQLWDSPMVEQQWLFSKSIFEDAHSALPKYTYDLDKAKALMKQANPSVKTGNIIVATPEQSAQGVAVQSAAEQLGLKLSIEKVPGDRAIQMIYSDKPRTYSMVMYDWGADVPDPAANLQFPFWSKNPINDFTEYKNPAVDAKFEQEVRLKDGDQRAKLLADIQRTIVTDQVWSVLYQINTLMVLSKSLGGYRLHPHFWYLDGWIADLSGT